MSDESKETLIEQASEISELLTIMEEFNESDPAALRERAVERFGELVTGTDNVRTFHRCLYQLSKADETLAQLPDTSARFEQSVTYIVEQIADDVVQRCSGLDSDQNTTAADVVDKIHQIFLGLNIADVTVELWWEKIVELTMNEHVGFRVRGTATLLLYQSNRLSTAELIERLTQHMPPKYNAQDSADFVKGVFFMWHNELFCDRQLFQAFTRWFMAFDEDYFLDNLPIFRRTFVSQVTKTDTKMHTLFKHPAVLDVQIRTSTALNDDLENEFAKIANLCSIWAIN